MSELIFESVSYELASGKVLLKDLNLSFLKGKVTGILGPNGSGKSTSFDLAVGLLRPSQGKVFWRNKDVSSLSFYQRARLGIGYLPQRNTLLDDLTVFDNLETPLLLKKLPKDKRVQKLETIFEDFFLHSLLKKKAGVLSGGERRRCELARLVLLEPELLFLDEPFAGVDPYSIEQLSKLLLALVKKGFGLILTDHNVADVFSLCDKVVMLFEGKVIAKGTPSDIISNPDIQKNYLGGNFQKRHFT
jgi:lipopolysaccharide export system ATP-binding protein